MILTMLALDGCAYETDFTDCTVRCSVDDQCPENLVCDSGGFCRVTHVTPTTCVEKVDPLSCFGGSARVCGMNNTENCCAASSVPGGSFFRNFDVASDGMHSSSSYSATISPFVFDRFEVTVGRFRKFVEAGMGTQEQPPSANAAARRLNATLDQGGWRTEWNIHLAANTSALIAALKCDPVQSWTDNPQANEALPINCLTWFEAFAFCAWDGGFLPTEAEWNFAAAAGSEQRAYPWSSPPSSVIIDCSYANYDSGDYCTNPPDGGVARVGSRTKGDGKYGQADLAGNVFEWTLDSFGPLSETCDDCANVSATPGHVLRGGAWDNLPADVRASYRLEQGSSVRHRAVGVRCARSAL